MPETVMVGPLALPLDRLAAIVSIWAFVGLAGRIAAQDGGDRAVARAGWGAVVVGLLAGRAAWVIGNWPAYRVAPADIVAFWQGGLALWPGVAAAALVVGLSVRRSRGRRALLAALAGIALIYGAATMVLERQAVRPLPRGIVLTALDGRRLELDKLRGRPFVVSLWASWCPPCRREMPMMAAVAAQAPMPVLLVNQGEGSAAVRAFLARQGLTERGVALDPGGALARATGAAALPTTLFVGADGRIRFVQAGEISRAGLLRGLQALARE